MVLRSEPKKYPFPSHYGPIEKLLIYLYFEVRDLKILSLDDYHKLLNNVLGSGRIEIAVMMMYAREQKLKLGEVLGGANQLIPPIALRGN